MSNYKVYIDLIINSRLEISLSNLIMIVRHSRQKSALIIYSLALKWELGNNVFKNITE